MVRVLLLSKGGLSLGLSFPTSMEVHYKGAQAMVQPPL